MSVHIGAKKGEIADTVLLPGDPLRAKYVAEQFLKNATCYNEVRGMYGYTGEYKGKRISVQGTGMGIPSVSIYVNELISEYGAKNLIRIGSCGSIQPDLRLKDVILAMTASTDSQVNRLRFQGRDFAPSASFSLLKKAFDMAKAKQINVKVGNILSTDLFYHDDPDYWKLWAENGVLVIEMETSALYTLAAKFAVQALSILTVSDNILSGQKSTSEERERSFSQMIELALELKE
ncbi:purine-nucleoside phosphorylase [candidate division KSB1 bacterium]|nr:purine-nucleoside phosphorylase [candidate division KSB1 bacterium]NIR72853.1 purine-nucleoside phosphorylase [candidate division KSB1 bacterium]NIS23752.1 purine-nucleoside phosphorylase [candidate division KSB1 bacterium]NIT70673.1 purine-nucleoside phosphorylase [candidate division KSB1 bacterium]NIU24402.1 purine-nucleoside phosphorylase [candidate division KSB1 bacterium]